MATLNERLIALENAAKGRWGEFEKPEGVSVDNLGGVSDSAELVSALVDILKEIRNEMTTFKEAMDLLVKETAETGSAVDAILAQYQNTVDLLRANAQNPEAILQIANTLEAYQQRLASAAVVGTPATQGDTVEPVPVADPVAEPPTPQEAATADAEAVVVPEPVAP